MLSAKSMPWDWCCKPSANAIAMMAKMTTKGAEVQSLKKEEGAVLSVGRVFSSRSPL